MGALLQQLLGYLPIGYIFSHMGYILLCYFLICIWPCLKLKSNTSIIMVVYLGLLVMAAWIDPIWNQRITLSIVHFLLLAALITFHLLTGFMAGKFGERILLLATIMVMADFIALVVDWPGGIHQSIVNILFIMMCHYTRKAGYNSIELMGTIESQPKGEEYQQVHERWYRNEQSKSLLIPF